MPHSQIERINQIGQLTANNALQILDISEPNPSVDAITKNGVKYQHRTYSSIINLSKLSD